MANKTLANLYIDNPITVPTDDDLFETEQSGSTGAIKKSDLIKAIDILDSIGSTRGSLLYRGASGWAAQTPGTSGYVWQSNGPGADPSWVAVSGGGVAAPLVLTAPTASDIPLVLSGAMSQTAPLQEWRDGAGVRQTLIKPDGIMATSTIDLNPYVGLGAFGSAFITNGGNLDLFYMTGYRTTWISAEDTTLFSGRLEQGPQSTIGTPTSGNTRIANIAGEINVIDASGNVSVISPHAKDAPAALYEVAPGVDEMLRRCNVYLGTVHWWATTRRQLIDTLDMRARLGTPEDSAAAWAEVLDRRAMGRVACAQSETCAAYEQRTGSSLYPGATPEERAAWAAMTPLQRWDSVQQRDVAASMQRQAEWVTRRDKAAVAQPPQTFVETEPALYQAVPAPNWIPTT